MTTKDPSGGSYIYKQNHSSQPYKICKVLQNGMSWWYKNWISAFKPNELSRQKAPLKSDLCLPGVAWLVPPHTHTNRETSAGHGGNPSDHWSAAWPHRSTQFQQRTLFSTEMGTVYLWQEQGCLGDILPLWALLWLPSHKCRRQLWIINIGTLGLMSLILRATRSGQDKYTHCAAVL